MCGGITARGAQRTPEGLTTITAKEVLRPKLQRRWKRSVSEIRKPLPTENLPEVWGRGQPISDAVACFLLLSADVRPPDDVIAFEGLIYFPTTCVASLSGCVLDF